MGKSLFLASIETYAPSTDISSSSTNEKRRQRVSIFISEEGNNVGYKRGKTREELKNSKPDKKKEREDKRKKKKLARLERQQYG